jgi:hypothetical protein
MSFSVEENGNIKIALLESKNTLIYDVQDALDLMANAQYSGADSLVVYSSNLNPDFFDLKTKLAGEILQKFSNYNMKMAIIGDFTSVESKSLRDFIFESNKTGRILFVKSVEEAIQRLKAS